ncbi:hypothetical protein [Acidovorax cavernicola]|uniref:Poly(3-hydroxyalkanoate) polymerase subunit PhaE n=1 Tax=Acidovorax cavernicola TaxID=1675792 RepID=A0A9X8D857_9BURK|nr:hypothetical protein [Acidovorax cavernicola]RIX84198.1 hypothetical protein D3H34_05685 [Acidovorax cavernicola]
MSQFPSLDPMAMWRELTAQWEKSTNEFANEAMSSDPFRQGMHGGMNASLTAQKALGDLMARYLTLLNLPTRADLQALGEQLHRIDDHLAGIRRALEGEAGTTPRTAQTADAATAPPRPRRTKQPPAAAPAPAAKAAPKKRPAGKRRP